MITLAGHDDYSPAIIAELICERLMEGASLRQIYQYQDRNMPARNRDHLVGSRISPNNLTESERGPPNGS